MWTCFPVSSMKRKSRDIWASSFCSKLRLARVSSLRGSVPPEARTAEQSVMAQIMAAPKHHLFARFFILLIIDFQGPRCLGGFLAVVPVGSWKARFFPHLCHSGLANLFAVTNPLPVRSESARRLPPCLPIHSYEVLSLPCRGILLDPPPARFATSRKTLV